MRKLTVLFLGLLAGTAQAQQSAENMVSYTRYWLYVPKVKPAAEGYPLLLFLHGSGERGDDLSLVKKNGPPAFLDDSTNFPFIVVSPQCPAGRNWDAQLLLGLLDQVAARYPVDAERVYATGLSMGGFGTWALAQAAPQRFAAIVPICGGGDSTRLCAMRHVPTWVFHGDQDNAVPFRESERLVQGLQKLGSEVKFTLYPGVGHDSWTATYANPEVYRWLLAHRRTPAPVTVKESQLKQYAGVYQYSPSETITIVAEGKHLYTESSVGKRKLPLLPFKNHQFRIPGDFGGDGEVYFRVDDKGRVSGLSIGPCDHTFCPKVK